MKALWFAVSASLMPLSAHGATAHSGDRVVVQDMTLTVPNGWTLHQDAKDEGTIILGFANGDEYLTMFVKDQTGLDMRDIFANEARIVRDIRSVPRNGFDWMLLDTSKDVSPARTTYHVTSFMTEHQGYSYYGYARTTDGTRSLEIVSTFLDRLQ